MSTTASRIAELRKSYERAELSEEASHAQPLAQFEQWLSEAIAAEIPEPNAMTLATVASDLRPSTRVVLIKGYDERGVIGLAEPPVVSPGAAISNAVANAIGVRVPNIPMTPEHVLNALEGRKA